MTTSTLQWIVGMAVVFQGTLAGNAGDDLQRFEQTQPHLGTTVTVVLYVRKASDATEAAAAAFARVAELENILSDYRENSEISRASARSGGDWIAASPVLLHVLESSQTWRSASDGAFNVAAGPTIQLWRQARRTRTLPTPQMIAAAVAVSSGENLLVDKSGKRIRLKLKGMRLDVGAIGKGYIGDEMIQVLKQKGAPRSLAILGGDVVAGDPPPGKSGWRVEVATLKSENKQPGPMLSLANKAASTSGDAYQFVEIAGKRYSHIIDPRTGQVLTARRQSTVVATRGIDADACSTACNVLGTERSLAMLKRFPGMEGYFISLDSQGRATTASTPNWPKLLAN